MTAAPVSDSAAPANGSRSIEVGRPLTPTMMDGKALAARIRAEVAEDARELGEIGLATVLVGDDPASEIYIGLKHGAANAAGIRAIDLRFPSTTSEAELLA